MKRLIPLFFLSFLTGCVASSAPDNPIIPIQTMTGGQAIGDATSLYWYSYRKNRSIQLSEVVMTDDDGDYQSDYRWRDGKLREIKRQGTLLQEDGLTSFSLRVRYDTQGRAVFQRYMVAGAVLPLSDSQLYQLTKQAQAGVDTVKKQHQQGQSLLQGHWTGSRLMRCGDEEAINVVFQPMQSDVVTWRLRQQPQAGYMAVIGKVRKNELVAKQLLILKEETQPCIAPPVLLDK